MLLLFTGLRVSELVNLKIADIDLLTLSLKVVGKGGKYREVPIKVELIEAIKEYMEGKEKRINTRRANTYFSHKGLEKWTKTQ